MTSSRTYRQKKPSRQQAPDVIAKLSAYKCRCRLGTCLTKVSKEALTDCRRRYWRECRDEHERLNWITQQREAVRLR